MLFTLLTVRIEDDYEVSMGFLWKYECSDETSVNMNEISASSDMLQFNVKRTTLLA